MPELPEVETVRRGLEPAVIGRTVTDVRFTEAGRRLTGGIDPQIFRGELIGRRIEAAARRGKYLLFPLDNGRCFIAHLRMTGRFQVEPADALEDGFFRAAIALDDGQELRWRDVRRFGTWAIADDVALLDATLGPEPLEDGFTNSVLAAACLGRAAPIKSLLLDQRRIAGLGNIYVDEALFIAGIHPTRPAGSLTPDELDKLRDSIRAVLQKGIQNLGTTLRDFVNAYGSEGRNQDHLNVYQRTGEPCNQCGRSIDRIVLGGRGTHFCAHCQPSLKEAEATVGAAT